MGVPSPTLCLYWSFKGFWVPPNSHHCLFLPFILTYYCSYSSSPQSIICHGSLKYFLTSRLHALSKMVPWKQEALIVILLSSAKLGHKEPSTLTRYRYLVFSTGYHWSIFVQVIATFKSSFSVRLITPLLLAQSFYQSLEIKVHKDMNIFPLNLWTTNLLFFLW